jgi:hypothetical protein
MEIYLFLCKKEYVVRKYDLNDHYTRLYPSIDAAFRVGKWYNCTISRDARFLYDFNFHYIIQSLTKIQMEEYFYTEKEIRKMKLKKISERI